MGAGCVTRTVAPPIVTVAERAPPEPLAAMVAVTLPSPVPEPGARVTHG